MQTTPDIVSVTLSRDEAWEMLVRCLASKEEDSAVVSSALRKLARALEVGRQRGAARCAA